MCALQIDPGYLAKINPQQIKNLESQGLLTKNEKGEYFAEPGVFPENCFVQAAQKNAPAAGMSQTGKPAPAAEKKPMKGVELEKSNAPKDKNIVSETYTTTVAFDEVMKGLTEAGIKLDEQSGQNLLKELQKAGVAVDDKGNITYSSEAKAQLETFISRYVNANQKTTLEFSKDTDAEFIQKLVDDGAVKKEQDGTYTILNNEKMQKYLSKEDQKPETTPEPPVQVSMDAKKTTTTVKKENAVEVPDDLRHNKDARKQLERDYEAKLTEWANDPENAETMKYSLAWDKYDKDISKKLKELKKDIPTNEEVLQKYYNEYATADEKKFIDVMLAEAKKDEKGLVEAYNRAMKGDEQAYIKSFDGETGEARKNIAAYLRITEGNNFNPEILLERMAVSEVMDKRSAKQIEKDKKYFIKAEAERQMKKDMSAQNVANTRVHFTKEERKEAQANEADGSPIEHTDIGKRGRELVMATPDEFCTAGTAQDNDFEINGKYYKFSEEKWKNYFMNAGDSRHLDDTTQENFSKDGNLTLNEGREGVMRQNLITASGTRRSFEQIVGNDNGKVGNKELNRFRDLAKTTGMTVDVNRTGAKRALHVLKNAGIGAALGFATAGLGSALAGAVNVAGTTAPQLLSYSGTTDGQWIDYSGTTDGQWVGYSGKTDGQYVTVNSYYTDKYGTTTITNNVPVPGQEYSGQVFAPGQEYSGQVFAQGQDYSGELKVEGQNYSDKGNNHLKTAGNAAMLGAAGGAISGLATMGKIHAKGQSFDGTVNLTKEVETSETDDTQLNLNIQKSKTVTIRSGQITEKSEVPTVKPVRYRGPEAYTVLYTTADGKDVTGNMRRQLYRTLDKMWREQSGGTLKPGDMPSNIPLYAEVDLGNGVKVKLADNYLDRYKTIEVGNKGGKGGLYNVDASEDKIYQGRGKITNS